MGSLLGSVEAVAKADGLVDRCGACQMRRCPWRSRCREGIRFKNGRIERSSALGCKSPTTPFPKPTDLALYVVAGVAKQMTLVAKSDKSQIVVL